MGSFLGTDSGSPLEARAGGDWGVWVILFLVLLVVIIAVYSVYKRVVKYRNSPAYLEKQKKRPTTQSDISEIAKNASLSNEEQKMLWSICKVHKTPNALFLMSENETVDEFFKEKFKELCESQNENAKSVLFSLRRKIFQTYKQNVVIKNSRGIEVGTSFAYTVSKGFHHKLSLVENSKDGLIISIPKSVEQMNEMPEELSKITLIFEARDGSPYEMETRVVRFQTDKNDQKQIVSVHTDKITSLKKRQAERVDIGMPCKFSSVKSKGENQYDVGEKEHEGTLEDVSTGGCRIITELAIKAEQYIFIKGPMNRVDEDTAIGQIVRTTKRADGIFVLHVRFLKIDLAVTNRIQACAIGYGN